MNKVRQIAFPLLISAPAIAAITGAIIYFVHGLDTLGAWVTIGLTIILLAALTIFLLREQADRATTALPSPLFNDWLVGLVFIIAWLVSIYLLYKARSYRAIITPWQIISIWYFVTYAIGTLCLILLGRRSSKLLPIALTLQTALLYGTAVIVYQIGYGFDPFIHDAAINAIKKLGQIIPLTPYYLGQYGIVIGLETLTGLSTVFWDKLLVPGLAALFLPALVWRWLRHHHGAEKDWGLAAILLLFLPGTLFIVTTPQSLAFLFLIFALLWPSPRPTRGEQIVVWLCALAAAATQPIAGIPAILLALHDLVRNRPLEKKVYPLLLAGYTLAIPLAFYMLSLLNSGTAVSLVWPNVSTTFSWLIPQNPGREGWLMNAIYLFVDNWALITLLIAAVGAYIVWKQHSPELRRRFAWPAVALLAGALVTSSLDFHFLIAYEKTNYADRLLITAALFSLPLIITACRVIAVRLEKVSREQLLAVSAIVIAIATASLYATYPRFDDYVNSHGYATSRADILAVRWINDDSREQPYIVLANQQTSAAALREFGFSKYYNNHFYYPIPTGGQLYQSYLDITAQPSRKVITEVRQLTGVQTIYVVVNDYWWKFRDISTELSALSEHEEIIGGGQIKIFKFKR